VVKGRKRGVKYKECLLVYSNTEIGFPLVNVCILQHILLSPVVDNVGSTEGVKGHNCLAGKGQTEKRIERGSNRNHRYWNESIGSRINRSWNTANVTRMGKGREMEGRVVKGCEGGVGESSRSGW
jgi:hypothetical protein